MLVEQTNVLEGRGIQAQIGEQILYIGNERLLEEANVRWSDDIKAEIKAPLKRPATHSF